MKRSMLTKLLVALLITLSASACQSSERTYLERLQNFKTHLIYQGPAPQDWSEEPRPPDIQEVFYESDGLRLKAWIYSQDADPHKAQPALVYFHGGFSSDFEECKSTALWAETLQYCPIPAI